MNKHPIIRSIVRRNTLNNPSLGPGVSTETAGGESSRLGEDPRPPLDHDIIDI